MEPAGLISKIQRYSTKDGPGIRSTVFFLGCSLNCKWCSNPELIASEPQLLYFQDRCKGCGTCVSIASNGSIKLYEERCSIDRAKLNNIGEVAESCPYDAYEAAGYYVGAENLAKKLLRDRVFYAQSGGGVTFSGGEPCLQAEFVRKTASLLRAEGVSVALDTAGNIPWETLAAVLSETEIVLYDIKAFDEELHLKLTGAGNELILQNARRTAETGKPMLIRLMIIPGINDSDGETNAKLEFIAGLGPSVKRVDILPYHRLGLGKYEHLGLRYELADIPECPKEPAEIAAREAEKFGLSVSVGG